jgi:hypothetical protein
MKTMRLLPTSWKWPGAILSVIGLALGFAAELGEFSFSWLKFTVREKSTFYATAEEDFTNEVALTLTVAGLLMLAFTRERDEDERVRLIRLEAFQWSILVNFIIILIGNWALYGGNFFWLMTFNLFTPLVVFLLRFYYVLYIRESGAGKLNSIL